MFLLSYKHVDNCKTLQEKQLETKIRWSLRNKPEQYDEIQYSTVQYSTVQ